MSQTLYIHPEYLYNRPQWQKAKDLLQGRHEILTNSEYLPPHNIESITDSKYKDASSALRLSRQKRTKYINWTEILLSIWTSIFYKTLPTLNPDALKLLDKDAGNIDGQGNSIHAFIKNYALKNYLNAGKAIILVDSPNKKYQSSGEEKAAGARPFFKNIEPLNFVDWAYETEETSRLFQLKFGRHEYLLVEPRQSAADPIVLAEYSDEYLYKDGAVTINRYKRDNQKAELNTEKEKDPIRKDTLNTQEGWNLDIPIPTEFNRIPISIIEDESWLKDANEESIRFHNLRSNSDNILFNQAFKRIILTGVDPEDAEAVAKATEASISFIKKENANLLQIEPTDVSAYERALAQSITLIYKIGLNQVRSLPTDSGAAQSADTIAEEKDNVVDLVVSGMEEVENLVNDALKNYADIKGMDNLDPKYTFNRKINRRDVERLITISGAFANEIRKVPEVSKQAFIEAVKEMGFDAEAEKVAIDAINGVNFAAPATESEAKDPIDNILTNA